MRVCVVGSGAREHALAEALGRTAEVVVTPGNPGIPGSTSTPPERLRADLFVIGPEAPLVDGLADRLRAKGSLVFGPGADGARLEGSKAWMKELLVAAGVPTAGYATFRAGQEEEARTYLASLAPPYVVKTDGLAAGKGVLVTTSLHEATTDVRAKLAGQAFGEAGRTVVIEEGLEGPEVSLMCVADGRVAAPLASAQDFKRVGDGDTGPNTGGMGAYSPVPEVDDAAAAHLITTVVQPTIDELRRRGIDYRGILYAGLMLTATGPRVLEYNVRFGDPETQVVLPRLTCDLAVLLAEAAAGALRTLPTFSPERAVTVVCAAEGYPAAPRAGDVIQGIEAARAVAGVRVFAAGVSAGPGGELVTAGGRVLAITGLGPTLAAARARAYQAADLVSWPGMVVRPDIAAAAAVAEDPERSPDGYPGVARG